MEHPLGAIPPFLEADRLIWENWHYMEAQTDAAVGNVSLAESWKWVRPGPQPRLPELCTVPDYYDAPQRDARASRSDPHMLMICAEDTLDLEAHKLRPR